MRYTVSFADLQTQDAAVVRGRVEPAGLSAFLGDAFAEVAAAARAQGLRVVGPPFGRYRPVEAGWEVTAGFPVSAPVRHAGRVTADRLPSCHVAHTVHHGPYADVGAAYAAAQAYVVDNGYEPSEAPWESYLSEPDVAEPRTAVFVPCRPVTARAEPTG